MSALKIKLLPLCLIFALLICSSCNITRIEKKGYMFDSSGYETLQEGVTTKQRVLMLMGSPTIISDLSNEELWIYYHEDVKELLFFKPKIISRTIIALKFDDQQTIKQLKSYDLSSEENLAFNTDFTAIQNRDEGFFKKVFGNVGQVRPF
jgi:outer membrane protein assembly factor BamE (lipoprotein component of BamABCDE complex)